MSLLVLLDGPETPSAGQVYLTAQGLEVLTPAESANALLTAAGVEILGTLDDAEVMTTAIGLETLQTLDSGPLVTALGMELLSNVGSPYSPAIPLRPYVTAFGAEVLHQVPDLRARVTNLGLEALEITPAVFASAVGLEALESLQSTRLSALGMEILEFANDAGGSGSGSLPENEQLFLMADWTSAVTMTNEWSTASHSTVDGTSERIGLVDRPYRKLTVSMAGLTKEELNRLAAILMRRSDEDLYVPLYQDFTVLDADATETLLSCDTTYRRLYRGNFILLMRTDPTTGKVEAEFASIADITSTSIVLAAAPVGSWPAGTLVFPVIATQKSLKAAVSLLSDGISSGSVLEFREVPGYTAIQTSKAPSEPITGVSYHDSLPIFPFNMDWSSSRTFGMTRQGTDGTLGRGRAYFAEGTRGALTLSFDASFFDRASYWAWLTFTDSRQGRLNPFWISSGVSLLDPQSVSGDELTLGKSGDLYALQSGLKHICVADPSSGEKEIYEVVSIADAGDTWTLTADRSFGTIDGKDIFPAMLAHFESDSFRESWSTDGIVRVSASITELDDNSLVITPNI